MEITFEGSRLYADRSMDTQVRFVISKKVKSVEVLLQKMFEKELSDELGEEELHKWIAEEEFDKKRRKSIWAITKICLVSDICFFTRICTPIINIALPFLSLQFF
ncbi:hypothetical protein Avbf_00796, partial [Armadillidium vulgare]